MDYKKRKKLKKNIMLCILWFSVIIVIFPIVYMVILSGATSQSIQLGTELSHFKHFTRNFIQMQQNINFFAYFKNSVIIVGITTIVALILATCAGYSLARFKFPGANVFGFTLLGTQLIPPTLLLVPTYLIFIFIQQNFGFHFINTYKGLIIPYVAMFTPMSIYIIRGFFAGIPKELEEAARIDGASQLQAFRLIILPLAVPGIIATGIFIFLTAWDELMMASILTTSQGVQTVPVGIRLFVGHIQNRYDLSMMASVVATVPIAIIFFTLQKYFISGMTAGAVKE